MRERIERVVGEACVCVCVPMYMYRGTESLQNETSLKSVIEKNFLMKHIQKYPFSSATENEFKISCLETS